MLRPGKRVALLETVLESGGQEVLHARGWRLAVSDVPQIGKGESVPPIPVGKGTARFPGGQVSGYLSYIDWRFVIGNFADPGPSQAWARPSIPLLPGEELSPMSRAAAVGRRQRHQHGTGPADLHLHQHRSHRHPAA